MLGLNGLFSNVLSLLCLADLGFGTAMAYSYYKPIAENDTKKIAALNKFYSKVYLIIAAAVSVAAAARESMRMSLAVFRRTFVPDKYCPADMGLYFRKFMIITAMAAAAALIDGACALIYSILGI